MKHPIRGRYTTVCVTVCITVVQHPPSVHMAYAHLQHELVVLLAAEPFGESIGRLSIGRDVRQGNFAVVNFLLQEMITHINVLSLVMELGVFCNGDGGLVINEECSGRVERMEEFCEELSKPDGFLGCVSGGNVLGFSTGECDRALLL